VWLDLLANHEDDPSPWIAEAAFRVSHTWGMPRPASDADLRLGVEALEDYLARFPAHQRAAQAYVDIALAWITRTQPENAALWLNRLLADARYQTEEAIPNARVLLGQVYRDQDRFEQAIRVWREYLTSHPADAQWSEVQQRVIDAEYLLALDKHREKQYDAARQLLSEFAAKYPLDPRNPGILVLFGRMNYEQQRWQAAIDDWQLVVSKHPHTNEASYAQYMIGAVLERHLDQPSEAIDAYGKVTGGSHATDARAAIERLTATSMTVVTERVFRSHEIPAIKLTTRNVPEVTVRVYRIDAEAYFRKSHRLDGIEDLDIGLIAPDVTFQFPIPEYAEHREFESRISLPEPEVEGRDACGDRQHGNSGGRHPGAAQRSGDRGQGFGVRCIRLGAKHAKRPTVAGHAAADL
jgi:alpha-2-macroglobulin